MRVLHIDTGKEWRGGQRQVFLLHEGLLKRNVESYIACNPNGKLFHKCSDGVLPYKYKGEANPISTWNLLKIINKYNPDIVHSHDAHSLTPAIFAKAIKKNLYLIHTRRVDFHIKKGFFSKYKYSSKYIDKLVAISKGVKNILIEDGIRRPIVKIYSGVDEKLVKQISKEERQEIKKKLGISRSEFVVGSVGSFVPHKDFETLIRAFALVISKVDNAKLLLVGNGELLSDMKRLAADLGMEKNVVFTGYVENVGDMMNIMDVYAATSKEEGLNTSVIEAMMYGLPVVTTNAGGLPELVQDGHNGYVCQVRDYKNIAHKINILISNKECYRKLANHAFLYSQNFSSNQMVQKYLSLYKNII